MAALPKTNECPTLAAVDIAIEDAQDKNRRGYVGMSSIGMSCKRALWYSFRWAFDVRFDALSLKRFDDGHRGEDVQAERLRMVSEIELHTHNDDGTQFGFEDLGGHLRGHMDGVIKGLIQAPKTWHVWEHKQVAEKKQKELQKLKDEDEKTALKKWNPVYYAQAVLYMSYAGLKRHYLTCASAGGRHTIAVRTDSDEKDAEALKEKAMSVIRHAGPCERINESPSWYECKWCDYSSLCHGDSMPKINCRTCIHSTPELEREGGVWTCQKHHIDIPIESQRLGCADHIFIPAMLHNYVPEDADAETLTWVEYKRPDGTKFVNGAGGFASSELVRGAHNV